MYLIAYTNINNTNTSRRRTNETAPDDDNDGDDDDDDDNDKDDVNTSRTDPERCIYDIYIYIMTHSLYRRTLCCIQVNSYAGSFVRINCSGPSLDGLKPEYFSSRTHAFTLLLIYACVRLI